MVLANAKYIESGAVGMFHTLQQLAEGDTWVAMLRHGGKTVYSDLHI